MPFLDVRCKPHLIAAQPPTERFEKEVYQNGRTFCVNVDECPPLCQESFENQNLLVLLAQNRIPERVNTDILTPSRLENEVFDFVDVEKLKK